MCWGMATVFVFRGGGRFKIVGVLGGGGWR